MTDWASGWQRIPASGAPGWKHMCIPVENSMSQLLREKKAQAEPQGASCSPAGASSRLPAPQAEKGQQLVREAGAAPWPGGCHPSSHQGKPRVSRQRPLPFPQLQFKDSAAGPFLHRLYPGGSQQQKGGASFPEGHTPARFTLSSWVSRSSSALQSYDPQSSQQPRKSSTVPLSSQNGFWRPREAE